MDVENLLDPELQMVMGPHRCVDMTVPKEQRRKTVTRDTPIDASWAPVKPAPNAMERLKKSAMCTTIFGSLIVLFFTWQQMHLMDQSVAVPSMLVCAVLGGLGVGRNAVR